ncbi:hypothetical protein HGM15179_021125 [Zosterops borbonicus]|uniref:Uncharacterized protein n=1 Tax=Zosterops borbonicus TaxID=364589 RepID=A0A8K1FX89_9PASS|nr:hypothetical protein HGM15179_021125 [Zosterops borbonicus]
MGLEADPDPKFIPKFNLCSPGPAGMELEADADPKSNPCSPCTAGTGLEVVVLLLIPNPPQIHPKIRVLAAPGPAGMGLEVVVLLLIPNPSLNPIPAALAQLGWSWKLTPIPNPP